MLDCTKGVLSNGDHDIRQSLSFDIIPLDIGIFDHGDINSNLESTCPHSTDLSYVVADRHILPMLFFWALIV